ncbi:putative serine/threonine-protein kinase par-1-like isoform X4 [Penaeus vannamei]|uniref:Putative serine/threonine-protein kinase par-1-like isoform X4 n=1 Tax=Penaeus vannamei TaxID=6689 RepID=A0A423U2I3_PENVA|nr:putative serine/threonine-protein kinase par-1-like isoform X4 [Penaeus vannamei]
MILTRAPSVRSVGVLTYVLLTGTLAFGGDTKQETFLNISQGHVDFPEDLFGDVSEQAKDFISHLLVVEPSGRLSVDEALEHQWLRTAPRPRSRPRSCPWPAPRARPEGHAAGARRRPPQNAHRPSLREPQGRASPRVRRHGEAAGRGASSPLLRARREASPRRPRRRGPPSTGSSSTCPTSNLKAASAGDGLSTKAKAEAPAPSAGAGSPSRARGRRGRARGPLRPRGRDASLALNREARGRPWRLRERTRWARGRTRRKQEQNTDGGGAALSSPCRRARLAQPRQGPLRQREIAKAPEAKRLAGGGKGGQGEQGARARRQGQPQGEAEAVAAVPAAPGLQGRPALADGAAEVRAHPGLRGQEDREGHDLLTRLRRQERREEGGFRIAK